MSASGPGYDGPDEQESLEELFGTVFDLAGEIASRISQDQVEARLRRPRSGRQAVTGKKSQPGRQPGEIAGRRWAWCPPPARRATSAKRPRGTGMRGTRSSNGTRR